VKTAGTAHVSTCGVSQTSGGVIAREWAEWAEDQIH
jgi:hypothetical protein